MDFVLSDDQIALQQELRRLLAGRVTSETRRRGLDRSLWRELGDMGVFSLTLPEANGGAGLGLAEAAIVFEELGRAAVPGPSIATFLASAVVPAASTGEAVVGSVPDESPAMVEHLGDLDHLLIDRGDEVVLASHVPDGEPVARPLDPLTPVAVVTTLPGGDVVLDGQPFRRVGGLLAAAMLVGLGQTALDLGVEHALSREQFGRPIGSFQAVKHILAEAAVHVECARAAVHAAAVTIDEGDDGSSLPHSARIVAFRAADVATRACIQVHGGMGFTWELDAHLWFKRALVLDVAFGGTEASIDAVAAGL